MIRLLKNKLSKIKNAICERNIILSPGDYLYLRDSKIKRYQLSIVNRILDIEEWDKKRTPFFYYTTTFSLAFDPNYNSSADDVKFDTLLKSYEQNGYNNQSKVRLSCKFTINDGTHRAALAWNRGLNSIPGVMTTTPPLWDYVIPKEIINSPQYKQDYDIVYKKFLQIQNDLVYKGFVLMCCVRDTDSSIVNSISNQLVKYCKVIKTGKYSNGTFFVLLPLQYDYYRLGNRLAFKSITMLRKNLKNEFRHVVLTDNFIDGKILFDKIHSQTNV